MTKPEFIRRVADRAFISQSNTKDLVDALPGVILDALKADGEALIPGIGKLVLSHVDERPGRNPKTGESLTIPAATRIKFKAGSALKEAFK